MHIQLFNFSGVNNAVYTSKNGADWDRYTLSTPCTFSGIATDGKTYVAVGSNGEVCTSVDGIRWSPEHLETGKDLYNVIWDGKKFVITGDSGVLFTGNYQ